MLQAEFGQTLGSEGVHIIDPFTGTGTFITRLLQSGLIKPEELEHKYTHEIHANEIVLLAYYIAAINIEAVYHGMSGGDYVPFEGICLTDTFQLYEQDDLMSELMVDNSNRRKRQKELDIRVIVGNPPYSVGQDSANDNDDNLAYPHLDERIREPMLRRSSGDSCQGPLRQLYPRDPLGERPDRQTRVSSASSPMQVGWTPIPSDGLRKCLADEFTSIHVFHLRGNQRTSGELSRKEGGKIFGRAAVRPIAITLLVKNPDASGARPDPLPRHRRLPDARREAGDHCAASAASVASTRQMAG